MTKKQWITFDLDGTLMQNPFGKYVFPEINKEVNRLLEKEEDVTKLLVSTHQELMKQGKVKEAYDWDEILKWHITQMKLELAINIEELVIKHSVHPKVYKLEEDIVKTLNVLKEKGYHLAVLTNGYYKYQAPVLKEIGIYDVFDEIITPDRVGTSKPDPAMLEPLLQTGDVVLHVGDRIDHDVTISSRLGIPSALIHFSLPEPLLTLSSSERVVSGKELFKSLHAKETKVDSDDSEVLAPTHVIQSIKELDRIL
ncbi:HAD-IA family hydrolase [Alteribacter aurantiacus]|uniref:HAD-IA family hydrolase n=1 Tax=Alteribacter aurantiacus TaxID=254410 RepID=UPI0004026F9F|nr:HAD-IA family hydrolase [Alteribacter aurantiacus]